MTNFKNYVQDLNSKIFSKLNSDEELVIFVHSEESTFIRFNHSRVRQNTNVYQHEMSLKYQKNKKAFSFAFNLSLDLHSDLSLAMSYIEMGRSQEPLFAESSQYTEVVNNGQITDIEKADRPADKDIILWITEECKNVDMVGLWCSGPVRSVSANSKGQFQYSEVDSFFFDYSIYNGPRASKGYFSTETWSFDQFKENIQSTIRKLGFLSKPLQEVKRGEHRVFLEPMAVDEIISSMSWGGFSQAGYQQGRSPLKKLIDKEVSLSEQISIYENLGLGYAPLFNSLGEIADKKMAIIEKGRMNQLLTSTATAKEYKLTSNKADAGEVPRSLEISGGTIKASNALKELHTGLYLSNLHYINWSDQTYARLTGMTRFACYWVEKGEIIGPIQDLRFDESVYNLFGKNLVGLTVEQELYLNTATYQKRSLGAKKVPGALIENFNFTL